MKLPLMYRFLTLLLLVLTGALPALAQRETDNWYFGQFASLEFNPTGVPVSFANSAMHAQSGSASISDQGGNLLFYTNGITVWNRLHQVMANGNGLSGNAMAFQSSIIIPQPGSTSIYYIITQEPSGSGTSLTMNRMIFNIVDIAANNGLGEVVAASKNTVFYTSPAGTFLSGKLTAVHHANNQEVWLITHRYPNNQNHEFLAFKITSSGIQTTPVASVLPFVTHSFNSQGSLKASPVGNWLAGNFEQGHFLFNFDNKTGAVTNPVTLNNINTHFSNLTVEFSPDGSKLYTVTPTGTIEQFDLNAGTPAQIAASRLNIAPLFINSNPFTGLQLASNGKIYAGRLNWRTLFEIAAPNASGTASNFGPSSLMLAPSTLMDHGFPNFIQSYFAPARFTYTGFCAGSPVSFSIPNQTGLDSVLWNFDDPASVTGNESRQRQPTHIFSAPGFFLCYPENLCSGF